MKFGKGGKFVAEHRRLGAAIRNTLLYCEIVAKSSKLELPACLGFAEHPWSESTIVSKSRGAKPPGAKSFGWSSSWDAFELPR